MDLRGDGASIAKSHKLPVGRLGCLGIPQGPIRNRDARLDLEAGEDRVVRVARGGVHLRLAEADPLDGRELVDLPPDPLAAFACLAVGQSLETIAEQSGGCGHRLGCGGSREAADQVGAVCKCHRSDPF